MPRAKREFLDGETLRRLSRPATWPWLAAAATEWSVIGATIWACLRWPHWWTWIPAILIIGSRQHALGVLAHEGAHFCVARSGRWNDLLANLLATYPLTFTVEGYRYTHFKHHWYVETKHDPSKVTVDVHPGDWTFPMAPLRVVAMLLRDIAGISQSSSASLLKYLWDIPGGRAKHLVKLLLYHGAAIAIAVWSGHPFVYLVLWIVPLFTVAVACYRIRSIAEHSGFGDSTERYARPTVDPLITTRTTVNGPLPRFLLAPYNISYHIEHHLYPSVPVFRLRRVHDLLLQFPEYRANAHVTGGHAQLLREITRGAIAGPT